MPRDSVPAPLLERLAQGELDGPGRQRLEALGDLDQRVAALKHSDQELLERFPPQRMVPAIQARVRVAAARDGQPAPARAPWFALAGTLAAAAAAVLIFVRLPLDEVDPGLRTKGGEPQLYVQRQSGPRSERLGNLAEARGGDVLQLSYASGGKRHGMIFSIDGNGSVTLHFPEVESDPTALMAQGEVKLPFAYRLDDAPAFERFVFVTSDSPLAVQEILAAARRAAEGRDPQAPLALPPDVEQHALTLRKRDP